MWSTIRQEWAKRDIFEVGPKGELTELAQLRRLTTLRMWSTIRQEWAKRDIFEVGPKGELTELALLRSLTCRVRRMKSFICQSWATYCVFVGQFCFHKYAISSFDPFHPIIIL